MNAEEEEEKKPKMIHFDRQFKKNNTGANELSVINLRGGSFCMRGE